MFYIEKRNNSICTDSKYQWTYLRILTFKTFRRVIRKFDLAMAPITPPFETLGTVSLSGDSGPQIVSHLQHYKMDIIGVLSGKMTWKFQAEMNKNCRNII